MATRMIELLNPSDGAIVEIGKDMVELAKLLLELEFHILPFQKPPANGNMSLRLLASDAEELVEICGEVVNEHWKVVATIDLFPDAETGKQVAELINTVKFPKGDYLKVVELAKN